MEHSLSPARNTHPKLKITEIFSHLLPDPLIAALETNLLQIAPTTIGIIPLSGFSKGAEATNSAKTLGHLPPKHKLTTSEIALSSPQAITEPSPQRASKMCCALNPSLSQECPFGERFNAPKNVINIHNKGWLR
ncbi:hypothetical protein Hanom_Chr11g01056741 [Helianthus anomalus]